jgi:hypothetical protein
LQLGQKAATNKILAEFFARDFAAAELAPNVLKLTLVEQIDVECALSELFSRQFDHSARILPSSAA